MSVCRVCNTDNAAGTQYCIRCGSQLSVETVDAAPTGDATAESLTERAITAVSRDEIPDALEYVNQALELQPEYPAAIRTRADILRRIGLTTQAAAEDAKLQGLEVGEPVYAHFGWRALALLLDGFFVFAISFIPGVIVAAIIYAIIVPDNPTDVQDEDALTNAAYGWYAVLGIIGVAYHCVLNGLGATLGKRVLRLRVLSVDTRQPIGLWRGILRYIVSQLGSLAFGLGWLWMLWDRNHQTWHDKAANSIVVRLPKS